MRDIIGAALVTAGILLVVLSMYAAPLFNFPGRWLGDVLMVLGILFIILAWRFRYKG